MGKFRRCLRAIKSTVSGRILFKLQNGFTLFQGRLTNDPFSSSSQNGPRRENYSKGRKVKIIRLLYDRDVAVFEEELAPLPRSECIVVEPFLLTTSTYKTDQKTPPQYKAPLSSTPPVSLGTHSFRRYSITGTGFESDRYTCVQWNTHEDNPASLPFPALRSPASRVLSDFSFESTSAEAGSQHQPGNLSCLRTVSECDLAPASEAETRSLEEMMENMLLDCLPYLPLSALPLQALVSFTKVPHS